MAIDVGDGCINRAANRSAQLTLINKGNPSNADGTITSICFYAWGATTGIEFATFQDDGSNFLTSNGDTNGSDLTVAAAGDQTFTSAGCDFTAFAVSTGEYIGTYFDSGAIESASSGETGVLYFGVDKIPTSGSEEATLLAGEAISLYATGEEASWAHKFCGVSSPGKVSGVGSANIGKVMGVAI